MIRRLPAQQRCRKTMMKACQSPQEKAINRKAGIEDREVRCVRTASARMSARDENAPHCHTDAEDATPRKQEGRRHQLCPSPRPAASAAAPLPRTRTRHAATIFTAPAARKRRQPAASPSSFRRLIEARQERE